MKSKIMPLVLLTSFLLLSQPVLAMNETPIADGYTEGGTYYTVYEVDTEYPSTSTYATTKSVVVSRKLVFAGKIVPPSTKEYVESINDIVYVGTLKLASFTFEDDSTIALYTGTLTSIN